MTVGKRKKYFDCSLKNQKRIKLILQCYLKKFMESFCLDIINMKVIKLIQQDADANNLNLIIEEFEKIK